MKTQNTINFSTPVAEVTFYKEEDYAHKQYRAKHLSRLDDIIAHTEILGQELEEYLPLNILADIRKVKGTSKEVRDYGGKNEAVLQKMKKLAILLNSGLSKVIGNIFLKFNKPSYETRLFTDEAKAKEWLLSE